MSWRKRVGGGKRDLAEQPIIEALRAIGAEVYQLSGTSNPDLLVCYQGRWQPAEVKTGSGKETKNQGAFPIWRTPQDALRAIGAED